MKTSTQIFFLQTCRGIKRLTLQLFLLCVATAFFVVSLNLFSNSNFNLQKVEAQYTTIATMEFYGTINRKGELVDANAEDRLDFRLVEAKKYDLSAILALDDVIDYDLRQRFAAYIPGEPSIAHVATKEDFLIPEGTVRFDQCFDVLRFRLEIQEPVEIPLVAVPDDEPSGIQFVTLPMNLIAHAREDLQYENKITLAITTIFAKQMAELEDDIQRLNGNARTDVIILYPDVEYAMICSTDGYFLWDDVSNRYVCRYVNSISTGSQSYAPSTSLFYQPGKVAYHSAGSSVDIELAMVGNPYGLQRYEDVKDDPEWQTDVACAEYTNHSYSVTTTNSIQNIPAWYKGGMYLQEGRMISADEYATGTQVCMVSAKMAEYQGWQIGDKLTLNYYEFDGYYEQSGTEALTAPWYYREQEDFFCTGTFEIVGIFGQRDVNDFGDAAEEVFYNPWNTIYVPDHSVQNQPQKQEQIIRPSTLTLVLKNGSIDAFKAAVEEMGLTDQNPGEYEIKFSYFDQGYSKIAGGLQEMHRNAKILLGLSSVLMLVTMVLVSFLFSRQHKHSAGILRMLGGSKKQAFTAILTCAAAVVAAGGIVGTILGGVLTQSVGGGIMGDVESAAVELATGASLGLTILTGLGCMVLFLLLTAIFTATYIGKEPRALLPEDKG